MPTKLAIATDIRSRADKLHDLFREYRKLCTSDDPIIEAKRRHHFTRYLWVLTSGYLELSTHLVYDYYIDTHLRPMMPASQLKKLLAQTSRIYNINERNLLRLTRLIQAPWEQRLVAAIQGDIQDTINELVQGRNIIAHGGTTNLNHSALEKHFRNAVALANLLHSYL